MDSKITIFEFTSYKFEPENKKILFNYKQEFSNKDPLLFTETITLPKIWDTKDISEELIKKLLESLHLAIGISYYKFYCAPKVKINYILSKKEANFWNTIYQAGLGEFYFRNKLDPKKSPKFPCNKNKEDKTYPLAQNNNCLVALSGGKDSIVAAELLKKQGFKISAMFTETNRGSVLVDDLAKKMHIDFVKIKRVLDKQVFDNHKYEGHIPISMIYAFLGIFYSVLNKHSYFVVANEYSSNFGNTEYKGKIVNHQWSKSSEFENIFSDYIYNCISKDIKYFSLVRPFYELRIAKLFSQYNQYFPYFSSCNKNFKLIKEEKNGLWCGSCPKCVFSFTLLSGFLTKKDLLNIFKKNLYEDERLLPLFKNIFGLGEMKPFDCVGTFEESKTAFILGRDKFKSDFIVKSLWPKVNVKKDDVTNLFKTQLAPNVPSQFRFSGMDNVLIIGYGKEGKVTQKFIEKEYPNLKIDIADEKNGKSYLKKQTNYDLAIKTPGIKKELITIPYTTATNIFFSKIKECGNTIIGITGSKGKSTTASLIYSILKESGKKVRLLGNIGNPMLEALLEPIDKKEIFVLELSSYQLADIEFSPNIAVVTTLFPEHMDYHNGAENYYMAKKNIINFQNNHDIFIYNNNSKILREWANETESRCISFEKTNFSENIHVPLIGEHNKENVSAAISVAKELNISEKIIKIAIEKFQPLPHRLELVGEFKNIKFYDDAISTTPESTILAIDSLKNVDTIFLGGEDRGYNFFELEKTIKKSGIKNIVLFPKTGAKIFKSTEGLNILQTESMEDAIIFAYEHTKPGKICLLSCASPSYTLWKNFEEKGNQFKFLVKKFGKISTSRQLVGEIKGVKYFEDTSATTPEATIITVQVFLEHFPDSRLILICGGQNKGLKYNEMAKIIREKVDEIIMLPGTASDEIKKHMQGYTRMHEVFSMQEAVKEAKKLSKKGDVVILSPGAASFNLFKNEFDRGRQFVEAVKKLSK